MSSLILKPVSWRSLVATSGSFQRVRWREQRRLRGQPYDQNISYRPAPQGATPHLPEIHSGPKDKSWGIPNGRDRFRFGQKASSHYFQVSSFLHDIHSWFLLRSGAVNITVALLWWPLCCVAASSLAIKKQMITSDRSYFADLIDLCFSNKGSTSNWISHYLNEKGITCEAFNSSVYFRKRHEALDRFKRGDVKILSCTDLASRGEY